MKENNSKKKFKEMENKINQLLEIEKVINFNDEMGLILENKNLSAEEKIERIKKLFPEERDD